MNGIGLRVYSNTKIFYAIVEADDQLENFALKAFSCLFIPLSLNKPERLLYLRNTLLDIFDEYNITVAGIKLSEFGGTLNNKVTNKVVERCNIEGVIQEALASSKVINYLAGQMGKLAARLGIDKTEFKMLIEGDNAFDLYPDSDWKTLKQEERESYLACFAAFGN